MLLAMVLGAIAGAVWKTYQLRQAPPRPTVRLTLMDEHSKEQVGVVDVDPRARRPDITVRNRRYVCERQSRDGFIYRRVVKGAWPKH